MKTSPSLLVALLTLCMITTALSLQCYECTNATGFTGVSKCDSDEVTKRTCDGLANRCMTVTYNFTLLNSQIIETKNCSSSLACDPQFEFSCKYLLARLLYLLVVVYNDNSTRIFSLYAVREQSLFCSKIGGEERKRRMQHK
ncbi:uncharacterized protein LOC110044731 [Orbicella faveolata]|uniref:uncharacterized protein LOC110044731 n=1 Tax=Orbicella faveolata TaxID=48498 RepID=UPI0009E2A423|nr:uncharacterized protein LOC110044731 [Orbicella faveolata]